MAANTAPLVGSIADQTISAQQSSFSVSVPATDAESDHLTFAASATVRNVLQQTAFDLDQTHAFKPAASDYFNSRGAQAKYFLGEGNRWFFILPDGGVHRWSGSVAASPMIGQLDATYHIQPSLLLNAPEPSPQPLNASLVFNNNQLTVSPPNGFAGTFDVLVGVSDGQQTTHSQFAVNIVNHAPTLDAISNQVISRSQSILNMAIAANDIDGDSLQYSASATSVDPAAQAAFDLKQTHQFRAAPAEYFNARGNQEKYFRGEGNRWFFILPNGEVRRWVSTVDNSQAVGTLDSRYHEDLSLLLSAQAAISTPSNTSLVWSGNQLSISPDNADESLQVTVTVSDGVESTSTIFGVTIINHAPVLNSIADQNASHTQSFISVYVPATDQDNDTLTFTATAAQVDTTAKAAFDLKRVHQLRPAASQSFNARGAGEKYFRGEGSGWFFILPTGAVHRWNGSISGSTLIGQLDAAYHQDLGLLLSAAAPTSIPMNTSLQWSGNVLHIGIPDGFAGSFAVTATVSDGALESSTSFDVIVQNQAPTLNTIADQFFGDNDSITVSLGANDADSDPLTISAVAEQSDALQAAAYDLVKSNGFVPAASESLNVRGLQEKYFRSSTGGWYYILPTGEIHRWAGTIANSPVVGSLSPAYHANLSLLLNANQPTSTPVDANFILNGNQLRISRPSNLQNSGTFTVTVSVSDGVETTSSSFDVTASLDESTGPGEPINDSELIYQPGYDPALGAVVTAFIVNDPRNPNDSFDIKTNWLIAVDELASIGANEVTLAVYREAKASGELHGGPANDVVIAAVNRAKQNGLKVSLFPLFETESGWRGEYNPQGSAKARFRSDYAAWINDMARIPGIDRISIGSELNAMVNDSNNDQFFLDMIATAKTAFVSTGNASGQIGYAANFDVFANSQHAKIWSHPDIDYLSVSAYNSLIRPQNAGLVAGTGDISDSVFNTMVNQWTSELNALESVANLHDLPIMIQEVGAVAQNYASIYPWATDPGGQLSGSLPNRFAPDPNEQAAIFESLFQALDGRADVFDAVQFYTWEHGASRGERFYENVNPNETRYIEKFAIWPTDGGAGQALAEFLATQDA